VAKKTETGSELAASAGTTVARIRRGPSPLLLIVGTFALLFSGWAWLGPITWHGGNAASAGWILVAAAVVVGGLLVLSPRGKRKQT
jgi:fatty acid desaturase